jgi:hypothetical protein
MRLAWTISYTPTVQEDMRENILERQAGQVRADPPPFGKLKELKDNDGIHADRPPGSNLNIPRSVPQACEPQHWPA